jgi:hypothetical protein
MKIFSIIESLLRDRVKRRDEARAGRIDANYAEREFQDTLEAAKRSEPQTYEKYKDD